MIKYLCDACKEEGKTTEVNLPTLNGEGVRIYSEGSLIGHKNHIGIQKFDLCDRCYGIIAMKVYSMTKMLSNDDRG